MLILSGKLRVSEDQGQYTIEISEFKSGDIASQLSGFSGIDWRSSVAQVEVDPDYDGSHFEAGLVDSPESATDFVKGTYSVPEDQVGQCVAVKITDILGESVVITQLTIDE